MKQEPMFTILLVLMLVVLMPYTTYGAIDIPSFLAQHAREHADYSVREVHISARPDKCLIIIEDAHCNVPVQHKLIKLTNYFNYHIAQAIQVYPLVLQEGGSYGPINTAILKEGKTPQELYDFLATKLERGEIGAAEFLHATEGGFAFAGLENPELYTANYDYFMQVARLHKPIKSFLTDLDAKLTQLRKLIFSSELQDFYALIQDNDAAHALAARLERLRLGALQYSLDLTTYQALNSYFECRHALEKINVPVLERDLSMYNQARSTTNTLEDTPHLITTGSLRNNEYPELYKYGVLQRTLANTHFITFIKEQERLESELLMQMAYTDEEKELVRALRNFHIIQKIFTFTLTRDEYTYYTKELTTGRDLLSELHDYIVSYYTQFTSPLPLEEIHTSAVQFYEAVHKRDDALATNIVTALNEYEVPLATCILGGFHTEGITTRLKEKGISFLVVLPTLDESDIVGMDTYYDVMRRFWEGYKE